MNPIIIEKAIDLFNYISDLCKKVIDAGDPEKYAKSVAALHQGVSDTYAEMRKIIINSDKFSDSEKLERLNELAEQEATSKEKCREAIEGNREHIAKIAFEVLKGFLTCGLSFVPAIAKNFKSALSDENVVLEIEAAPLIDDSETKKVFE